MPYYSFLLSLPAAYHIPHGLRFALSYFSLPTYDAATATTIARVLAIGMWATVFKLGAWAWGWIKVKDPLIEFRIPLWRGIAERFFGSSVPKAA